MSRKPRIRTSSPRPTGSPGRQRGQTQRGPLVVLNTEAIRKEAFRQIQKQRKALEKETRNLDRFLHVEQPSYFRWLASVAGELLTEIREKASELEHLENLVAKVRQHAWREGIAPQRAYREVCATEARRSAYGPTDMEGDEDPFSEENYEAQMKEEFSRFVDENIPPDLKGSFRDQVRRFSKEAFGEDLSWLIAGGEPSGEEGGIQLKALYRQMVGILHPDRRDPKLNQDLCTELWHDLQQAYHARDLERLRTVYARAEYSLGINLPQQTTVWELRAEVESLRVAHRAVKNEINQARLSPAWQFSTRDDLDAYAAQLKRQLRQETRTYKEDVAALKALIQSWAAGHGTKRRSPRRKKEKWPQTSELF